MREARDALTSTTGTRVAFDYELLRQFAENRLSASLVVLLLVGTVGMLSSLWTGAVVAGVALRRWLALPGPKAAWDAFVLRLPVFGRMLRAVNTARFAATLAILTAAGVVTTYAGSAGVTGSGDGKIGRAHV